MILSVFADWNDVVPFIGEVLVLKGFNALFVLKCRRDMNPALFETEDCVLSQDFVVISNVGLELKTVLSRKRPFHAVVALCCVLFIAVMSAFNWISLVLATLIAVLVLVAFRTMSTVRASAHNDCIETLDERSASSFFP